MGRRVMAYELLGEEPFFYQALRHMASHTAARQPLPVSA